MIYTSYFAFIPKLPADMLKISISLFTPKWAEIDGYFRSLNPTEQLLKEAKSRAISSDELFQRYREEILSRLSFTEVYEKLIEILNKSDKHHLALLCYEKPSDPCHRRIVAEWLEKGNNIFISEFTFEEKQLSLV